MSLRADGSRFDGLHCITRTEGPGLSYVFHIQDQINEEHDALRINECQVNIQSYWNGLPCSCQTCATDYYTDGRKLVFEHDIMNPTRSTDHEMFSISRINYSILYPILGDVTIEDQWDIDWNSLVESQTQFRVTLFTYLSNVLRYMSWDLVRLVTGYIVQGCEKLVPDNRLLVIRSTFNPSGGPIMLSTQIIKPRAKNQKDRKKKQRIE